MRFDDDSRLDTPTTWEYFLLLAISKLKRHATSAAIHARVKRTPGFENVPIRRVYDGVRRLFDKRLIQRPVKPEAEVRIMLTQKGANVLQKTARLLEAFK